MPTCQQCENNKNRKYFWGIIQVNGRVIFSKICNQCYKENEIIELKKYQTFGDYNKKDSKDLDILRYKCSETSVSGLLDFFNKKSLRENITFNKALNDFKNKYPYLFNKYHLAKYNRKSLNFFRMISQEMSSIVKEVENHLFIQKGDFLC